MPATKPSERRHAGGEKVPDLNLVPIMAIMTILVPMLIFMFTFHQIKVQRVSAPRRGTGAKKASEDTKKKELNLTIMIKRDGRFVITWEQSLMAEGSQARTIDMVQVESSHCGAEATTTQPARPADAGCEDRGGQCFCYDFASLYNGLVALKQRFGTPGEKEEKRINITADLDVPWSIVSRTMDATTCRLDQDRYDTFEDYAKAQVKPGEKFKVPGMEDPVQLCQELFPQVVFALAE